MGVIDGLFLDQILSVLYLVFLLVFVPVLEALAVLFTVPGVLFFPFFVDLLLLDGVLVLGGVLAVLGVVLAVLFAVHGVLAFPSFVVLLILDRVQISLFAVLLPCFK